MKKRRLKKRMTMLQEKLFNYFVHKLDYEN